MDSKDREREHLLDSCRAIEHFIRLEAQKEGRERDINQALLEDLLWKASKLNGFEERATSYINGMYYALPKRMKKLFTREMLGLDKFPSVTFSKTEHKHVGILAVIKPEIEALLQLLFGKSKRKHDWSSPNFRYWFAQIKQSGGTNLSVVISMVGEPRNVPCAIAVGEMLRLFSIDLMVQVGIAAGVKGEVKIGDVVAADTIYDYESVRAEIKRKRRIERPRPLRLGLKKQLLNDIAMHSDEDKESEIREFMKKSFKVKAPVHPAKLNLHYHHGTIAAGERLFADGSLRRMRENIDTKILAGDQEDSGFAQACTYRDQAWCVFRGISDYGDPHKNKKFQFFAALSAAISCLNFLSDTYRSPESLSLNF